MALANIFVFLLSIYSNKGVILFDFYLRCDLFECNNYRPPLCLNLTDFLYLGLQHFSRSTSICRLQIQHVDRINSEVAKSFRTRLVLFVAVCAT